MKPDATGLAAAVAAIERGEPVVIPTDTVYGLAVRAGNDAALDRIFELKRRPPERSIAVLVADLEQATELADFNEHQRRVATQCWPGALTLVVHRRAEIDGAIGRADGTVGIRCPDHTFVRTLARAVGPLATTSANLSGQQTPARANDAAAALDGTVAVVIDAGPCDGQASTVAGIDDDGGIVVFRQGSLSAADLTSLVRKK